MKFELLHWMEWYNSVVLLYFLFLNMSYVVLLMFATYRFIYFKMRTSVNISAGRDSAFLPSITILAPAHNEELTIIESIAALERINYPDCTIIIINDGSSDSTLEAIKRHFRLFETARDTSAKLVTRTVKAVYASAIDPRIIVIDKENGGKADALNAGLNYARSRLVCSVDADTVIEPDALEKLVRPYLERDAKTIAVGGIVRIANGCSIETGRVAEVRLPDSRIVAFQVMEYIRAFLCGRTGWSEINTMLIISGAFGLFDLKTVHEVGGYRVGIVGEDMEIVVRLHRMMLEKKRPYKMIFEPDPVCWTQAPETFSVLQAQRDRWQRGLIEALWYNRGMLFNPAYGRVGLIGMPYYFIFEMLGPVIEITGYIVVFIFAVFGWLNWTFIILFILLTIVFGVLLSLLSLLLEEFTLKRYERPSDVLRLFFVAVLENFGYRQMNSWWRFVALFRVFSKNRGWGEMKRRTMNS